MGLEVKFSNVSAQYYIRSTATSFKHSGSVVRSFNRYLGYTGIMENRMETTI